MAVSRNYIQLQQQIADELGDNQALLSPLSGSALTDSPIKLAIGQAIAKWERVPFYFNETTILTPTAGSSPWQTALGQEYYSDNDWSSPKISQMAAIEAMWVLVSGNRYPIESRTADYLVDVSINPSVTSYPTDYAYTAEAIRLYPIPNGQYDIGINGTKRLNALSDDTDNNAWTQDAFDLIRCEAKLILARETLFDAEVEAGAMKAIYGDPISGDVGYLGALQAMTARRKGQGRIIPTYF